LAIPLPVQSSVMLLLVAESSVSVTALAGAVTAGMYLTTIAPLALPSLFFSSVFVKQLLEIPEKLVVSNAKSLALPIEPFVVRRWSTTVHFAGFVESNPLPGISFSVGATVTAI
jgi:hypothetical protein